MVNHILSEILSLPNRKSRSHGYGQIFRQIITRPGPGRSSENSPLRIFVRSGQPANQLKAQPLASEIKDVYAGAAIA
jgi:hypothetical protein